MNTTRWSVSLVGVIGVLAAMVAGSFIWLLLTDPVQVANAVETGEVAPVIQALGAVLYNALKGLFRFL
ncbi:MAG: hypothetical protein R2752_10810 [Vicinamibacterales bacterium]